MHRPNLTRSSVRNYQLLFVLIITSLLILNLWTAGAKSTSTKSTAPNDKTSPATPSYAVKPSSPSLSTTALVTGVSPQTVARSGYFKVTGSSFGASRDSSSHLLVNSVAAIVVRWSDSEIAGYIPEASILGSVPVQVATAAGTSNAINVNVTMRQTNGRIRWRVELAGDYATNGAVVAPATVPGAGTIYVATNAGYLYAWAPDGALKWVALGADGDTQVSVGADGTIYTGGTNDAGSPAVIAWNPDGTQKWEFADSNGQSVRAGPNVGPDGKIYVIFRPLNAQSVNFAAIRPDGSLAWFVNRNFYKYGQFGGKEIAFGRTTPHVYFAFDVDPDPDWTFTNGGFFAYDFDGHLVWERGGLCCGVPAVAPDGDLRHYGARLNAQTGATVYDFDFPPQGAYGTDGLPDAGPTNIHYVINRGSLWAINPNGSKKWRYDPLNPDGSSFWLESPVINPTNNAILMGGGGNYGQDTLFLSVDPTTGQEQWRQFLPREPGYEPYGNFYLSPQAVYSADGNTGYMAADINGDQSWPFQQKICVLYSMNTGASGSPINQPPQVTITNPLTNSNVARNVPINVTARVQDDGAIDRVEFHYAHNSVSVAIGTDTTPDANGLYSASFTPTDSGGYSIYVVAYDTGGLRGDAPYVSININNELPHINWVSPANGVVFTVPPSITLTAHATDADGTVTKVDFNSSEIGLLGTDTSADAAGNYTIVWANPPVGTHNLYAWATDNDGYRIEAIITITVNAVATPTPTPTPSPTPIGNPPTVSITGPADFASFSLGTSVTVTADAHDSDGTVTRVDFYRAPSDIYLDTATSAPYSVSVNSANPDAWDIIAVATDNSGNTTTSAPVHIIWEDPNGGLSISGRVRHQQSSPGNEIFLTNAHVQLLLHGTLIRTTLTDSGGNYLLNNLSYGGEYTVQPAEPGYQFFPPAVIWSGLVENETWDFVAAGPLPNPTPTPTPALNIAWENFYDGPQHQADLRPRVAVDTQGNTYITGTSGSATTGDSDISTIKYSPTGQLLWVVPYYGSGGYKDWANDIKVDSQGNVYVTGVAWGGNNSEYDALTIKYDTDGNQVWARLYNGPIGHWDRGESLDLIKDSNGNVTGVVIAGYSQMSKPSGALYDEFVTIKYDSSGIEQWVRRRSTAQISDHAMDVVVDSAGNAYVTGFSLTNPSAEVTARNFVTVKYSPAGLELWAASVNERDVDPGPLPLPNNPTMEQAGHIALDSTGNVYVAGTNEPGTNGPDFLLLKFDPETGALLWSRNWAGASSDQLKAMAIDAAGNIYLTGESYDRDYETATGNETADVATIKFDGSGNQLWQRFYRGFPGMWDGAKSITLDSAGNAYVGLLSEGFFNGDSAVIKYLPDGTEDWVFRYDNPEHSDDNLSDMAADGGGNIYLASSAGLTNAAGAQTADLLTVKLAPAKGPINSPPQVALGVAGPGNATHSKMFAAESTTSIITGRTVLLEATAADRDGTVDRVDFYDGPTLIGSDNSTPYTYQWNNAPVGTHAIIAAATDNSGATRSSQTLTIDVSDSIFPVSIRGQVTSLSGVGVSNVSLRLLPLSSASPLTIVSDATGNYLFANLVMGDSYTVTPSKTKDTNGVTAFDASMAARYAANLLSLTPNQMVAADASNNGTVSAFDASMIARTAAGIPNEGMAGTWKFAPTTRVFNNLTADEIDQNFVSILVGDVSGNWTAKPGLAETYFAPASPRDLLMEQLVGNRVGSLSTAATITASLPSKHDLPGGPTTIPITLGDVTGQNVFSYYFDLAFDPSVLQPQVTPFDASGTLSNGWSINANTATAGHLVLNAFSTAPMSGQGTLLFLKFNVIGGANGQTTLTWQSLGLNEGAPASSSINGFFTAAGPTATQSTVSGRIVTETGNPLAGVVLTLIGSQGDRKVVTNAAGDYRFIGAATGQFYTVIPTLANYTFSPTNHSFSLLADKTDAVFTAAAATTQTENAIDSTEYFVRQQYLDFLGREPDQGGLAYWSDRINQCQDNVVCVSSRRSDVSAAFFVEQEFQASGLFIYDLYTGTLGRRPLFAEYSADRRSVVGGANLETDKTVFARKFVQRAEFVQKYQLQTTAESFVEALIQRALLMSVDLSSERGHLIDTYNRGSNLDEKRALVVQALADSVTFKQSQYNAAFVLAEYFSYLRRDPDQGGYDFWLNVLNNRQQDNYRGMVCSFITSAEYQRRFGSVITHSNGACGQ